MNFEGKNVLISQLRLHDYAGSEIVTLEIAEYFVSKGANVSIVTFSYGEPIDKEFKAIKGVNLYRYGSDEINEYLDKQNIDLMWVHHQIIPRQLVENPRDTKFIFHHMSPYIEVEQPFAWRIERSLADLVLVHSEATKDIIEKEGLLSDIPEKIKVLGNPAPDYFLDKAFAKRTTLKKLLVISNHIQDEVELAISLLEGNGVRVDKFGAGQESYRRIRPSDINNYDAVLTIGKTVQYSLLAKVPVFLYDRFGGPGYLLKENFNKSRELNFSGKGYGFMTPEAVSSALIGDYKKAAEFAAGLDENLINDLTLSKKLDKELKGLVNANSHKKLDSRDVKAYFYIISIVNSFTPKTARTGRSNSDLVKALRKTILKRDKQINDLDIQMRHITGSNFYKIFCVLKGFPLYIKRITQLLLLRYVPDNSGLYRDDRSKVVGELLDEHYQYRPKLSGLRVAVVARGMTSTPTSSFFIRLASLLTVGEVGRKINLALYDGQRKSLPVDTEVCIVQRTAFDDIETARVFVDNLRKNGTKIVLDTDDAFSSLDPSHPQYAIQKGWLGAFDYVLKSADRVWISTNELLALDPNATVYRNALDSRVWDFKRRRILTKKTIDIVYMGTMTHDSDLDLVLPAIEKINKKHPDSIKLTVIGVVRDIPNKSWLVSLQPPDKHRVYPEFVKWLQSLNKQFDIGIAPLVDSEFNMAKSDIKVLDYLSMGVLPVVSDLLPYQDTELDQFIVRVGYTEGDWLSVLEDIVNNRSKYVAFKDNYSDAAHAYVTEVRSVDQVAKRMLKELRIINKLPDKSAVGKRV